MIPRSCKLNVLIRSRFKGRMFSTIEVSDLLGYSLTYTREMMAELLHLRLVELVQAGEVKKFDIWRVVP